MLWIRAVGSALALLLLMTSIAVAADSPAEPVETHAPHVSLATISSAFKASVALPVVERTIATPTLTVLHRLSRLTGGHSISAGFSSGEQTLGIAHGHVVVQRWTNFHITIGLFPSK